MPQFNIIFLVLLGAGLLLIILAIIKHDSLSSKIVIDLKWGDSLDLKTNAFGIIILAGVIILFTGIYVMSKNYENQVKSLKTELTGAKDALKEFKQYDLRMRLEFPEISTWNPNNECNIKGYVQKKDDFDFKEVKTKILKDSGGAVVYFKSLNKDDILKVKVEQSNYKWASNNITIPTVQLNMELIDEESTGR